MGTNIYVNGMEPLSEDSGGMCSGAMPDTCFTPPPTPATPTGAPVPYPNTAMASDLQDGSNDTKFNGKPTCLKDKSCLKKSCGDEAGVATTKGLVTQTNMGKVYFAMWSPDVKCEGENLVRHLDIGTHNHAAAQPGQTPPWPPVISMAPPKPIGEDQCQLVTYKPKQCPKGTTAHHCVPDHCFRQPHRWAGGKLVEKGAYFEKSVEHRDGLCVCVPGKGKYNSERNPYGSTISRDAFRSDNEHYLALASHGRIHKVFDPLEEQLGAMGKPTGTAKLGDVEDRAAATVAFVTGCDPQHLKDQIRKHHQDRGLGPDTPVRADPGGQSGDVPLPLKQTVTPLTTI